MKLVALGLLALIVLASAKPAQKAKKISSRQKRQADIDFGSFDLGSFDIGSFDIGSFDPSDAASAGDMMQSFANSMLEQGGLGSFDSSQLDEIDGEAIFNQMGSDFSNMVSQMSSNIPDPLSDPMGFASYASMMESRFEGMGDIGDAIVGNMFEEKLTSGLSNIGLTSFAYGEEVDAGMLMEQMSSGAWGMMSTMSQNADMFSVNTMSSDDFITVMDVAGEMDSTLLNSFLDMKNNASAMTPEMMQEIPLELFGALDPGVLGTIAANFTSDQTMVMCAGMEYLPSDTAMDLMQNVDCTSYYMNYVTDMDIETEMAMLEAKAANTPMSQWTDADWEQLAYFGGGFTEESFDFMSDNAVRANIGTFAGQVDTMGEAEMFSYMDNLEDAFGGDFATMDAATFAQFGSMIQYMDPDQLLTIPATTKLAALDSYIGIEMDDDVAAYMAEEVLDLMPPMDQWGSSEFIKCIEFVKYNEEAVENITMDAIIGGLSLMGSYDMDPTESITITDRIMGDAIYGNPANWNSSMLKDAGSLLAGFSPAFIEGMDGNEFYTAVSSMNDSVRDKLQIPRETARAMIEKVASVLGNNPITPKLLGPVVKSMTSSEIAGLPRMNMNETIPVFSRAYDDMDQSSRRAVVEMAAASPGGLSAMFDKLGPFFKDLSLPEIDSLPYDLVNPKSPPANPVDLIITPSQARRGWQNFASRVGQPSKAAGNWTMKMWKFMGPLVCGIPCSEINKIPISSKFMSILNLFVTQEKKGCLNDAQMTCMAKRLRQYFFKNNSMELDYSRVTKTNIQKAAYYMVSMNLTDLNALNISVCQTLLNNVGKFELNMIPRSSLVKLKNYLMNCTGKAQSGEKITLKELRSVGDLQCGIEMSDVNNFETKVYKTAVSGMLGRCTNLPLDVVDALVDKMLAANTISVNDLNITESQLMGMGGGIFNLNETMLNKIAQTTMTKSLGRIKKVADKLADKEEKRAANGLSTDSSAEDIAAKEARKTLFYTKATESVVAQRQASAARRKRSTYSSLTCADLKKMGTGVTSLTVSQLNIDDSTYSSCYGTLGAVTGWSTDQKSQLATTAKRVWGAVTTWTTSKLLQVGTIAQGLSDSDLSAITYTNDIVSSLGKYTGWTTTQLSSIYSKWASGLSSTITSSDLQSLGDIACGASTSQISAIAGATYKGAASQIGSLLCNSEAQLQAWAGVAKTSAAFGAVSTWDASTIATVGTVIGGLSASEISTLSSTQIEAISSTTISSMPNSAFSGFTATQLGYMTTTQVRGISSSQAASLSADARSTLESNANYVTTNTNSSAGTINVSLAVLLAVTIRALFL